MDITYYFPWIRKGLSNCINELDTLGSTTNMESLTLHRPKLFITPNYDITPVAKSDKDKPKPVVRTETKEVEFISPGDITNINKNAIIRVVPKEKSDTFPKDYLPYIEFYEPDFPWRYSPALPNDDKLRPWLAILVCKNDEFSLEKSSGDSMYVSLKITTETEYKAIFLSPQETWKAAHAQGKDNVNPIYSRLLAMRREDLERQTEYTAFLVPLFETGRLRGLGYGDEDMVTIAAQASAWEENLALQKQHHPKRPLDFPVYHYWTFKTGEESFDALAERLTAQNITELGLPADIQVNVTDMGEGLSYSQLSFPYGNPREVIGVPVATVPIDYLKGQAFPYPQGVEIELYERMKDLLSKNPVFVENLSEISGEALEGEQIGDDDPWVSPPIYGGKHAMATSLETKDNRETPWIPELNTDVHNRIAAGMGKKIVQENQEEFVNRAWKQVDAITALNQELRQRLLSSNTGNSIRKRITKGIQKNQKNAYLSLLMKYLDSLKYASTDSGSSLAKVLNDNKIPLSFATATFHQLTSGIEGINETDLLDRITTEQIFRMKPHDLLNLTSMKHIRWLVKNKDNILDSVFQNHVFNIFDLYANDDSNAISDFFIITKKTKNISGEIDIDQLKEIYSYVGKEICFTNKLRNGKYTSGIEIYLPDYHLDYWHNFITSMSLISYYGNAFGMFNLMDYILNENKISEDIFFNSRYSGYIKGKKDKKNVIAVDDEEYESFFGDKAPLCTKVGGEKGFYFVPRKKVMNKLKTSTAINAYIKIPYITCPFIENYYQNYKQTIGIFKLLWDGDAWNLTLNSNDNDANITIKYDGNKKLNNLFINIDSKPEVLKQIFGGAANIDMKTINSLKDFFAYPVKSIKDGDGNVRLNLKYRLSSYYHPFLWPFTTSNLQKIEDNSMAYYISLSPDSYVRKEANIIKDRVFPMGQGFHYPQGCFGNWRKTGEETRLGRFFEFVFDNMYWHHRLNTKHYQSYVKESYSTENAHDSMISIMYRKVRDNFLFLADPLNFEKLFYIQAEKKNGEYVIKKDPNVIFDNYAFNNNTMPKELSYDYSDKKYEKITTASYNKVQKNVEKCAKIKEQALEYLFTTPDYIEIDINQLEAEGDYQELETLIDIALQNPDKKKYLDERISNYNSLLKIFENFEEILAAIDIPVQPEEVIPSIEESEIDDIQDSLLKNEGYEQMVKVAQTYYSEFFANTEEGRKLRDKYVDELLHSKYPIMAYPIFPEPTYYYLREMSEKFILPCVEQLPQDSIALFRSNSAFEEAYLCGMNTEMGKELLWREYPTDQRGSYFRKFWDSETNVEDIRNDNFFDIKTLHHWKNPLGKNHNESKSDLLIFAIKGKLIKQYPSTLVYLHKAIITSSQSLDFSKEEKADTFILPELTAWVSEDTFLVGFKKELANIIGNPQRNDYGYFLAFKEDMLDINFAMFSEAGNDNKTAGNIATKLVNTPSIYGKHVSLFV